MGTTAPCDAPPRDGSKPEKFVGDSDKLSKKASGYNAFAQFGGISAQLAKAASIAFSLSPLTPSEVYDTPSPDVITDIVEVTRDGAV